MFEKLEKQVPVNLKIFFEKDVILVCVPSISSEVLVLCHEGPAEGHKIWEGQL